MKGYKFQSTRPRGARLAKDNWKAMLAGFNPRARVGRDASHPGPGRPPAGFNPRARVGRDQGSGERNKSRASFNPRARVGRDQPFAASTGLAFMFQSTRPRGARPSDLPTHESDE